MSIHVLVIDDSKLMLIKIRDLLEMNGFRVSATEDVVHCNDIIYSKSPPDLILMDVSLPLMSGDHKTRIIKSRPKSSNIPIILISSMPETELKATANQCGADDYLAKPFDDHVLMGKINRLLLKKG